MSATPTCGHEDGWCGGVLGPDTCTQRPGKWSPLDDHPGRDPETSTDEDCDRAADAYEERFL